MSEELLWLAGFTSGDSDFGVKARPSPNSRLLWRVEIRLGWSQNGIPHVAGWFNADGAFMVRVSKTDAYKVGYSMQPYLRGSSTNDVLLSHIKMVLEEYEIGYVPSIEETKKGRPDYRLAITRVDQVKKICAILLPYLVGSKKVQCDILLNKIIPLFEQKKHLTREGFIEIMEWRDVMTRFKRVSRTKYNAQFLRDLWSLQKGA